MGEVPRKIEDKAISYGSDIVKCLNNQKDFNNLNQCWEQSVALRSQCDSHFTDIQSSIQDYQKKIDMCKKKVEEAKSLAAEDAEMGFLQKELEDEFQRERLLREELRVIKNELGDLEHQRVSVAERKQILKKLEQDELRAQMTLSMYASVTNIIPNLDDQSKISGHIVERDKKVVETFEFDLMNMSAYDTCNRIWKMINF